MIDVFTRIKEKWSTLHELLSQQDILFTTLRIEFKLMLHAILFFFASGHYISIIPFTLEGSLRCLSASEFLNNFVLLSLSFSFHSISMIEWELGRTSYSISVKVVIVIRIISFSLYLLDASSHPINFRFFIGNFPINVMLNILGQVSLFLFS